MQEHEWFSEIKYFMVVRFSHIKWIEVKDILKWNLYCIGYLNFPFHGYIWLIMVLKENIPFHWYERKRN